MASALTPAAQRLEAFGGAASKEQAIGTRPLVER
jgi:hypothetical protein